VSYHGNEIEDFEQSSAYLKMNYNADYDEAFAAWRAQQVEIATAREAIRRHHAEVARDDYGNGALE